MKRIVGIFSAALLVLLLLAAGGGPAALARAQQQQQIQQQQQQQQQLHEPPVPQGARQSSPLTLVSALQSQAQRHMGQLGSLLQLGASQLQQQQQQQQQPTEQQQVAAGANKLAPVLEAISNVGKAIQQQIGSPVQIVGANGEQAATSKKNEYQVPSEQLPLAQSNSTSSNNYREQGEMLRQEIVRRAGQLQQVVASSMDLLKNNGDLIVRRLLDQMNVRLDQAKQRADRILSDTAAQSAPQNELALKALSTINLGLNNLNHIISNIVARLDAASKEQQQQQVGLNANVASNQQQRMGSLASSLLAQASSAAGAGEQGQSFAKLRANLHQLGQQFQSALGAGQRNSVQPPSQQQQQVVGAQQQIST